MTLTINPALAAFMAKHRLTFDQPTHSAVLARANQLGLAALLAKAGR